LKADVKIPTVHKAKRIAYVIRKPVLLKFVLWPFGKLQPVTGYSLQCNTHA
jgi:uncharacterized membrane protein